MNIKFTTPNRSHRSFKQRGVALWLIFAAIGLLAALAAALSSSSRSSTASTASDVQNTYASAILSQAASIKQGLDHMVVNGKTQASLTFTNVSGSANDLFGSGNSVLPTAPARAFLTGTASPWVFYAPGSAAAAAGAGLGAKITGVGLDDNWLIMLKGLSLATCTAINNQVSTPALTTAALITTSTSLAAVTGTTTTAIDLTSAVATTNQAALCVKDSTGSYNFYFVLLEQ